MSGALDAMLPALLPSGSPPASACAGLESILGGVAIGPDNTNFAFAFRGLRNLAVRRSDGHYFVGELHRDEAEKGRIDEAAKGPISLRDVTCFVSPSLNNCVYRLPVGIRRVKRGDIVVISDTPNFNAMFVEEVVYKEDEGALIGTEICNSNLVRHRPARLAIGGSPLVVKATSIFDAFADRRHDGGYGEFEPEFLPFFLSAFCAQPVQTDASGQPMPPQNDFSKLLLLETLADRDADRDELLPLLLCGGQIAHPFILMLALRALRRSRSDHQGRREVGPAA